MSLMEAVTTAPCMPVEQTPIAIESRVRFPIRLEDY